MVTSWSHDREVPGSNLGTPYVKKKVLGKHFKFPFRQLVICCIRYYRLETGVIPLLGGSVPAEPSISLPLHPCQTNVQHQRHLADNNNNSRRKFQKERYDRKAVAINGTSLKQFEIQVLSQSGKSHRSSSLSA